MGRYFWGIRSAFALLKTASFIAMLCRIFQAVIEDGHSLPLQWRLLMYLVTGCLLPVLIVLGIVAVDVLFWRSAESAPGRGPASG